MRSFGSRSTDRSEGRSGPQIIPFGRDRWTDAFDVACFRAWTLRVSNGERRISARTAVVHRNSRAGPNMLQRQSFQLGGALLAFSPPKSDAWLIHGHINRLSDRPPQRGWRLAGSRAAAIWVRGLPSGDGSVDVGIAVIVANGLHQRMQIGAGVLNEVRCRPQEKEWVDAKLVKALATPALRRDCTTPGTWRPVGESYPSAAASLARDGGDVHRRDVHRRPPRHRRPARQHPHHQQPHRVDGFRRRDHHVQHRPICGNPWVVSG